MYTPCHRHTECAQAGALSSLPARGVCPGRGTLLAAKQKRPQRRAERSGRGTGGQDGRLDGWACTSSAPAPSRQRVASQQPRAGGSSAALPATSAPPVRPGGSTDALRSPGPAPVAPRPATRLTTGASPLVGAPLGTTTLRRVRRRPTPPHTLRPTRACAHTSTHLSWACSPFFRPRRSECPFPSPHLKGAGRSNSRLGLSGHAAPCCSAPRMLIDRNAIVASQPWNRLAGGHAR